MEGATGPPKYRGIFQTMVLVTKEEGPLALWKGNGTEQQLFVLRLHVMFLIRPQFVQRRCYIVLVYRRALV
jgi:hypothetical protein